MTEETTPEFEAWKQGVEKMRPLVQHMAEAATVMLKECAQFYEVPVSYRPAIADVMTMIMAHVAHNGESGRWNLPQHWASMYSYVVGALASWANPNIHVDGQGRTTGLLP